MTEITYRFPGEEPMTDMVPDHDVETAKQEIVAAGATVIDTEELPWQFVMARLSDACPL